MYVMHASLVAYTYVSYQTNGVVLRGCKLVQTSLLS